MRITSEIKSPNYFMSAAYEPGQMIDFTDPPLETDLDKSRNALRESLDASEADIEHIVEAVNVYLMSAGITRQENDLQRSLGEFTKPGIATEEMILNAYAQLFPNDGISPREKLLKILDKTHVLNKPPHIPVQVYSHIPGESTDLRDDATHFGYVLNDGESNIASIHEDREYPLYPNTVFAFPGAIKISGEARMRIFSAIGQKGILTVTGDIGDWGRQNYIDGCTSTLLISPVMKGDACMNSLYFPEGVEQTQHTHPSIRAGIIAGGEGICRTPVGDIPLTKGNSFFLPPETWHSFHTEKGKTLNVVAFHPDSDFGPTHEDHPMLNRTHFQFLHLLKSALRLTHSKK
jgi:hypothetical protein